MLLQICIHGFRFVLQHLFAQWPSGFLRRLSSSLQDQEIVIKSLLVNCGPLTSAASAAFLPASSSDEVFAFELPPSVLGGPPTFLCARAEEVIFGGGAEETVRPGWEKGSFEDSLPQRAPIVHIMKRRT